METVMDRKIEAAHKVCPWWMGYLMDNPLRRRLEPLDETLGRYVRPGMTVLDIGCGFGYYSIAMARMVGGDGIVVAADVQDKMLQKAMARARKAGVAGRMVPHRCPGDRLALDRRVDFAVAGNVLHELPDLRRMLAEVRDALEPGGLLYVVEPQGHVKEERFEAEVDLALELGFAETARWTTRRGYCVVLRNDGAGRGET